MGNALKWAYPCFRPEGPKMQDGYPEWPAEMLPGLTKREHAAIEMAKAMIGTAGAPVLGGLDGAEQYTAKAAIRMADALLAELERRDD